MNQVNEYVLNKSIARRSKRTDWLVFHAELIHLGFNIDQHFQDSNHYLNIILSHPNHPKPQHIFHYIAHDHLWQQLSSELKQNDTWQTWWASKQTEPPGLTLQIIKDHPKIDSQVCHLLQLYERHYPSCIPSLIT